MDEYVLIATTDPEPKDQSWVAWGTLREIHWLSKIGEHADAIKDDRLTLLKKYQASMTNRVNWGIIDPEKIKGAVAQLIKSEIKRRPPGAN